MGLGHERVHLKERIRFVTARPQELDARLISCTQFSANANNWYVENGRAAGRYEFRRQSRSGLWRIGSHF